MEIFGTINSVYVFVGSVLLGLTGGILGVFAVLRKQGLLGDALAHSALPGIAIAFLVMQSKFLPGLLLGAIISGLIGAFFIYALVKYTKVKMDSAMATILSVFFGLGILILTHIQKLPMASQSGLESFLFGNASAILREDIMFISIAFVFVLLIVAIFWKELKLFIFDLDFSRIIGFKREILEFVFMSILVISVVMSLQVVGVVLTAAVLITPAVSAMMWSNRLFSVVLLSAFFGVLATGTGAVISAVSVKMPTGPVIVLTLFFVFLFSFFLAPKKGLLWRFLKRRKYSRKVIEENILGALYRSCEGNVDHWSKSDIEHFGFNVSALRSLRRKELITGDFDGFSLTELGMESAAKVVEKHRLWETYLVNRMNLDPGMVHKDAETIEHVLTDEIVVELKKILGDPVEDPHGKPIHL